MAEHKLDIFEALAAVDRQDGDWLERQPEENQKGFTAPVFLRWASSVSDGPLAAEYTLDMVNNRVNLYSDALMSQYPDLIFRLAASCGIGSKQRHDWIPNPKRGSVNSKNVAWRLIADYNMQASDDEIDMLMSFYTKETFKAFIDDIGLQPDKTKEATKAFASLKKACEAKTK